MSPETAQLLRSEHAPVQGEDLLEREPPEPLVQVVPGARCPGDGDRDPAATGDRRVPGRAL